MNSSVNINYFGFKYHWYVTFKHSASIVCPQFKDNKTKNKRTQTPPLPPTPKQNLEHFVIVSCWYSTGVEILEPFYIYNRIEKLGKLIFCWEAGLTLWEKGGSDMEREKAGKNIVLLDWS